MSLYHRCKFLPVMVRIFQERPVFMVPRGRAEPGAEAVRFPSSDGLRLAGCYLKGKGRRRGVILFGVEFGGNCWSCLAYCHHLVQAGFDVFAFEPRNQGQSDHQKDYEPLQWVTDHEVRDTEAALAYLKSRPDADPRGVGFFGISKGAGAGVLAACGDPYVRCVATDGLYATYPMLMYYSAHWVRIYTTSPLVRRWLPSWYHHWFARMALRRSQRQRHCRFPPLEEQLGQLAPRPLLMIHGGADSYVKPELAQALLQHVGGPSEFWLVPGAKHNQALNRARDDYQQRVLRFFESHLAGPFASGPSEEKAGSAVVPPAIRQGTFCS